MPRSQRLLTLLDLLRRRHGPVTAETLAQQLSVSTRTVYRDIAQLCAQGADIRGEAGLGFVLHTDLGLPPLMFDKPEIEALVFGMRWVAANGDDGLAADAKSVLAKIDAVLPGHLKEHLNTQALYPRPCQTRPFTPQESETLSAIRTALRGNRVLSFDYTDAQGRPTRRSVRPLAVGYFPDACLLAAWCEKRRDFRHFRTDRMSNLNISDTFPVPRMVLLREWQRQEDLDLSVFEI